MRAQYRAIRIHGSGVDGCACARIRKWVG